MNRPPSSPAGQSGQALAECMVVLGALAALWLAIGWLSRIQDIALQASHASRHAAFAYTRSGASSPLADLRTQHFSGRANQWRNRAGESVFTPSRSELELRVERLSPLSTAAQPGGGSRDAGAIRSDWRLHDTGVLRAGVLVQPGAAAYPVHPSIFRQTSILTSAGHAVSDEDTQARIPLSQLAWSAAADPSRETGRHVAARMQGVDAGWGRPAPVFDWLSAWAGEIPGHQLVSP